MLICSVEISTARKIIHVIELLGRKNYTPCKTHYGPVLVKSKHKRFRINQAGKKKGVLGLQPLNQATSGKRC